MINYIPLKIIINEHFSDCLSEKNLNDVETNVSRVDGCDDTTDFLTGMFTTGASSYLVSAFFGGTIMGESKNGILIEP